MIIVDLCRAAKAEDAYFRQVPNRIRYCRNFSRCLLKRNPGALKANLDESLQALVFDSVFTPFRG